MVNLPETQNVVPMVRAPHPGVSPGQVAAPFIELADNLNRAGEVANTAAVQLATQAGHQAVTRDADGNLTIQKTALPLIGDAAPAYARAARFDYLAQRQPEIESKATEFQLKFAGDPSSFKKAWDTYGKETIANETDPLVKAPIANTIAHVGGQADRHLQIQANSLLIHSTVQGLQARLTMLHDESASLARQGGVDTDAYRVNVHDQEAIYKELENPLYGFSKDRIALMRKEGRDNDLGQKIVGEGVREFKSKQNVAAAQQWFQDKFWGEGSENLALTPAKRDHFVAEGLKSLMRVSVEDRVEVQAFRGAVSSYTTQINKDPYLFNDIKHTEYEARAKELGDYKTQQELSGLRLLAPTMQAIKSAPAAEKNAALLDISRNVVPKIPGLVSAPLYGMTRITSPFGQRVAPTPGASTMHGGIDLAAAAGTPVVASGAGVVTSAGPVGGYGNMVEIDHGNGTVTRYAHLGSFGVKVGDQIESGAALGAAGATGRATGPHLHFEVLQNGKQVDPTKFLSGDTGLTPGQPIGTIRNPYIYKQWENFTKEITAETGRNAEHLATQIISKADTGHGILPETIETFVASAMASGKNDLLDKVMPVLKAYDIKQQMPPGLGAVSAMDANIASWRAKGVNPAEEAALIALKKMNDHDAKQWREAPLIAGAEAQLTPPVGQLDTSSPQAVAKEFASRQQTISTLQHPNSGGIGPTSAIADKNEGEVLKTALTQGPVDAASGILAGMEQTLRQDTFKATMASEPMKEALGGMIRSRDPARMSAGFAALDKLWQMDRWGFKSAFGDANLTHLQAWQGLKNSFNATELAERLNKPEDPSTVKARELLTDEAKKEAANWKPADVAYQIGSSMGIPVVSWLVNPLTGATADAPALEGEGLKMVEDFRQTYSALRTYNVDPENAKKLAAKRISSEWGPTNVGGVVNTLMKHPPDAESTDPATGVKRGAFYPMIDGSHDWMRQDLYAHIAEIKGAQGSLVAVTPFGPLTRKNWNFVGLTSDPQTESEIAQGKPPSYQIWITNKDGALEQVRDPKTGQSRFRWDAQGNVEKSRRGFMGLNANREFDASLSPPFAWRAPPVGEL